MSALQDHDYCVETEMGVHENVQVLDEAPNQDINNALENLSFVATEFPDSESSHSPAHSTDSGIENTMDPVLSCLSSPFETKNIDFEAFVNDENIFDFDFLLDQEKDMKNSLRSEETKNPPALLQETQTLNKNIDTLPRKEQGTGKVSNIGSYGGLLDQTVMLEKSRKNAIAARENRKKKKKYIQGLEDEAVKLRQENACLRNKGVEQQKTIEELAEEVSYLKSVISNQSTISLLLKNIVKTPGISFSSSLVSSADQETKEEKQLGKRRCSTRKRSAAQSSIDAKKPRISTSPQEPNGPGVCLHVQQNKVSLELCVHCNDKSRRS